MGPAGANQQNLAQFSVFFCAAGLVLINNICVEFFFVTTSGVVELRWQQGTQRAGGRSWTTSSSHTLLPGARLLLSIISGNTCVHSMRWPKPGAELWLKRCYSVPAGGSTQIIQSVSSYSRYLWRYRLLGRSE